MKERDNNLVEVFEHNTVIFRGIPIDEVWLSVTYDKEGIYLGFGGQTCGGYFSSSLLPTRIPRKNVRAILLNTVSIMFGGCVRWYCIGNC